VRHETRDVAELGGFRLQKFAARRGVVEEIAHFNSRAGRPGDFLNIAHAPARDFKLSSSGFGSVARFKKDAGNRGDRRKRFTAKAQS